MSFMSFAFKCSSEVGTFSFFFPFVFYLCIFPPEFDFLHMQVLFRPNGDSPFPALHPFISCLSVLS